MANFDGRLIDPDEPELARALGKAMKAANRENKYHTNRMERDAAFWGRFARDVLRGGGPEGRRRSCKGGHSVPEVVAGWWTDPAGRKHVRVIGRTRRQWSRLRGEVEMRSLPPWWHVYPEAVLGVRQKNGERFLAVCRCGAVGAPESLGWMGDTCGPCFDRRAEGGSASGGYGQFAGWASNLMRFAFTADGRHLVGQSTTGAFRRADRADGTAVSTLKKGLNFVSELATADGLTALAQGGTAYRWRDGADDAEAVLVGRGMWGTALLSPDGRRAVLVSYRESHTCDLTAAKPKWVRGPVPENLFSVQFAPDGKRLLATTTTNQLLALDPVTLASAVVRDAAPDVPTVAASPPILTVSPDGAAVLLRRDYYGRRGTSLRHVPLSTGKAVELRVPDWHRAMTTAFSPDGRFVVTAETEGGWVGFFEVASGKALGFVRAVLEDTAWRSGDVRFAPDGAAVAVSYNCGHMNDHGSTIAVWPWPDVMLAAGV